MARIKGKGKAAAKPRCSCCGGTASGGKSAAGKSKGLEKLRKLGLDLPMMPTTSVGSFPKQKYLMEARRKFTRKQISIQELEKLEKQATIEWIKIQEDLDIDILVDGEMYRGDMVAYFAERMPGFRSAGTVRSYGNRYYHKPAAAGEIRWPGPMTVEWWKFAQAQTKRPMKGMLTGPYTVMDWSFNEHYKDRRAFCLAFAKELRKEVEALVEAGCKIIQVDEPAVSVRPEEMDVAIEGMGIVTDGIPAYFLTHICYGAFDKIYPKMLKMPVDNFDLELSNSGLDMLALFKKYPFTKDLSLGVVDVHTHKVEEVPLIKERILQAMKVIPKEQLWIDPDCGLKTREHDQSVGKLKAIVEATKEVRACLAKAK